MRRIGWRLLPPVLLGLGVAMLAVLLHPTPLGGFAAGALTTATVGMAMFLIAQEAGTVPGRAGADAERFTSEALRPAARGGWVHLDGLPVRGFDVDHVLIGPAQAYAVETKWSATPWRDADPRLEGHLRQARRGARHLRLLLRSSNVGHPVDVQPVLVLWGRVDGLETGTQVDGVLLLRGREVKQWCRSVASTPGPGRTDLRDVADRLHIVLRTRAGWESASDDDPFYVRVGPGELTTSVARGMVGFGGTLAAGIVGAWMWPWIGLAALFGIGTGGCVVAMRRGRFAAAGLGAALGGLGSTLWSIVVVAAAVI